MRLYVWSLMARFEIRAYWKRLLVGAVLGWLTGSVVGAVALTFVAVDERTLPLLAYSFVLSGIALGVGVAYAGRER